MFLWAEVIFWLKAVEVPPLLQATQEVVLRDLLHLDEESPREQECVDFHLLALWNQLLQARVAILQTLVHYYPRPRGNVQR